MDDKTGRVQRRFFLFLMIMKNSFLLIIIIRKIQKELAVSLAEGMRSFVPVNVKFLREQAGFLPVQFQDIKDWMKRQKTL
jgi:hypothetical protein